MALGETDNGSAIYENWLASAFERGIRDCDDCFAFGNNKRTVNVYILGACGGVGKTDGRR
ncbi:MAG: hypothetical protein CL474_05050 [Acidobacteria bacterium]|nr:hypothetical protein [Acidobacteriota bacterium]